MKLCVFQGTFNPIHNAHLSMAAYIEAHKELYDYDKILFIPAYIPPHKRNIDKSIASHRLEMVKRAVKRDKYFDVSDIEYRKECPSYTYYTIKDLYNKYDIEGKIGFIIGLDAFLNIQKWFEADKLKNLVKFIVFTRGKKLDKDMLALLNCSGYEYSLANMDSIDISSTQIREMLKQRQSVGSFVPKVVTEYIKEYGLYRN